jgi:hypothetical protein
MKLETYYLKLNYMVMSGSKYKIFRYYHRIKNNHNSHDIVYFTNGNEKQNIAIDNGYANNNNQFCLYNWELLDNECYAYKMSEYNTLEELFNDLVAQLDRATPF